MQIHQFDKFLLFHFYSNIRNFEAVTTKYVKLVITKTLIWNNVATNASASAAEFSFYKPYAQLRSGIYTIENNVIGNVYENTTVKQFLAGFDISQNGKVIVTRNGNELILQLLTLNCYMLLLDF